MVTGAGVSTASGISDYRDTRGEWKHSRPMEYKDFVATEYARQRYWARSALGRSRFKQAKPNTAHLALAELEAMGRISMLITQNVDGLHQLAGSRNVIDLHGRLDSVLCLQCGVRSDRDAVQSYLMQRNPFLSHLSAKHLPDGDTLLEQVEFAQVDIPACQSCGGILKPDVVFYGENVPAASVRQSYEAIDQADALLIVGSSLMVYSGFRFARYANDKGIPVAAINQGVTRADDIFIYKEADDCGHVLTELVTQLTLRHHLVSDSIEY